MTVKKGKVRHKDLARHPGDPGAVKVSRSRS